MSKRVGASLTMFEILGSVEFTGKKKGTEVYFGICDDLFFFCFSSTIQTALLM